MEVAEGPYPEQESVGFDMADLFEAIIEQAKCGKDGAAIRDLFCIRPDGTDEPWSDDEFTAPLAAPAPVPTHAASVSPPAPVPAEAAPTPAPTIVSPSPTHAAQPASVPPTDSAGPTGQTSSRRGRKHKKTAGLTTSEWEEKQLDGWERLNEKILKKALQPENIHVIPELDLSDLVDNDQERNSKPHPEFGTSIHMTADEPFMLVDKNGIPVVIIFPGWLAKRSHELLYKRLMDFGRRVDIQVDTDAADKNTRNAIDCYTRLEHEDEIHGLFQLVSIWRALGRSASNAPAGPAKEFTGKTNNLNCGLRMLRELRVMTMRLMDMFKRIDEDQFRLFTEASSRLKARYPAYSALAAMDPSFLHGRSLIYNRETGWHTDRRDHKLAWTPVTTLGRYTAGKLHVLGREIDYLPGTLAFIRGGILPHAVTFSGGQRVAIAHFMHKNVLAEVGASKVDLKTYKEMPGYESEPDDYESEELMD